MAFCFTVGTHDFTGRLEGYENVTAQCHNCGNWSAQVITEWPWFTICFVPVLPLAFGKYKLVACPICHYKQDIVARPDVQSQANAGGLPQGGPPGPPHQGPPGQQPLYAQPPQGYQQQAQPQYK